jgi:hypothetical protein
MSAVTDLSSAPRPGHDREPHGDVRRRHEDLAAHARARPLEHLLEGHLEGALPIRDRV